MSRAAEERPALVAGQRASPATGEGGGPAQDGADLAALAAQLACPRCRGPLAAVEGVDGRAALACRGAHATAPHPLVGGAIPALIERPIPALARAALDLREVLKGNDEWLGTLDDRLRKSFPGSPTRHRLQRLRDAEAQNRALLDRVYALVRGGLTSEDVLDASILPADTSAYARDFNYLLSWVRRDWGGRPESEAEIGGYLAAVHGELARHRHQRGPMVALGAAMGRIAWSLRREFPAVVAVDASPLMAALFRLLSQGPLEFAEIALNNARTPEDQARPVRAQLIPPPAASSFAYVLGDATRLPLPDASQAAVISVYFTDVVPLSSLGPEIARVLRPGGLFVHVGPTSWHFYEVEEQLSAEELADRFGGYGFEVSAPRVVQNTLLKSSALLDGAVYDNLVFSAVRV